MGYVPEIPDNRKFHKKYHDETVNGLRTPRILSDSVIWEQDLLRITVVNFNSPKAQKMRAQRISSLAHRDGKYDFPAYSAGEQHDDRDVHLFIGYVANRGISFFSVEKRSHIWRCTWKEYKKPVEKERLNHPPIRSVGRAWVHRDYRLQGWARRLAEHTALFFALEIQQLGWNTPFTDNGEAMVRSLCPDWFYIAK